jgi:cytochrome bd-type quinol oxidase subunit 1
MTGHQPRARLRSSEPWLALNLLVVLVPLQFVLGDLHGLNTRTYQPAKLAAIEGVYDTAKPDPLVLFGVPDDAAGRLRDAIEIPHLGSLILTHTWSGEVKGLNEWPRDDRPPVWPVFLGFRIMVAIGVVMLAIVVVGWAPAADALRDGLVSEGAPVDRAAGVRRGPRGLDDDGSWASTLDRLRTAADRGLHVTVPDER